MGAILAAWAPSNPPDVGSVPKGVATLFFSNKEPSKTSVWLPCSGHVQEQKRLPPWLANDSTCGLQGSRLPWGFMLRACLCGVRACVHAGSCHEANMTLSDCLCHACLCLCCMRARVCAESGHQLHSGDDRLAAGQAHASDSVCSSRVGVFIAGKYA